MKITLVRSVQLTPPSSGRCSIIKETEGEDMPVLGERFPDSLWNEEDYPIIVNARVHPVNKICHVELSPYYIDSSDKKVLKEFLELAESKGWEI